MTFSECLFTKWEEFSCSYILCHIDSLFSTGVKKTAAGLASS